MKTYLGVLVMAAITASYLGPQAIAADDVEEIIVRAPYTVQRTVIDRDPTGRKTEEVSLSRQVFYADIDLRSPSGVAQLHERVKQTARDACRQLKQLYPSADEPTDAECVKRATAEGLQRADVVMASARR